MAISVLANAEHIPTTYHDGSIKYFKIYFDFFVILPTYHTSMSMYSSLFLLRPIGLRLMEIFFFLALFPQ